jgi:hypothetical protein
VVQEPTATGNYIFIQNDYDDRMVAAIELKSEDFDDPNFSPLFTRARK